MQNDCDPQDVLVRFFVPGWDGHMPDVLYDRCGIYQPDANWRERADEAERDDTRSEPMRVVDSLRSGSCWNFLKHDLAEQGYLLARVNLHGVAQNERRGRQWMITLAFVHRSHRPDAWRDQEVVDWVQSQFVGSSTKDMRVATVSVVVPSDESDDRAARLVTLLAPEPVRAAAPVFQLRLDGNGFWVQDPDDPEGSKEISVEEANLRSLRHTAPMRAQNDAGAASNAALRDGGGDVEAAKVVAHAAALAVFTAAEFTDAFARADAVVASINWEKKLDRARRTVE